MLLALLAFALPVQFEPNTGQAPAEVRFVAREAGMRLARSWIEVAGVRMKLPRMPRAVEGLDQRGVTNYYCGPREAWRIGVPGYARVRYREVFPGIDLAVYGRNGAVEYDWLVAPGADPSAIRFRIEGAAVALDPAGDLIAGRLRHRKPVIYQESGGARTPVRGGFVLRGSTVTFDVGPWDRTRELVIDPLVVWAHGFGSAGQESPAGRFGDTGYAVALDRWLGIYVAGVSYSSEVPCEYGNCSSYFVTRLDQAGDNRLYTTYFGVRQAAPGAPPVVPGRPFLAVDPDGFAVVAGTVPRGEAPDAAVFKFTPEGAMAWSMHLGGAGNETTGGVALDQWGHVWVAGTTASPDFPIAAGGAPPAAGAPSAFLARIEHTGARLLLSTALGPAESATLALDAGTNPHVAGVRSGDVFVMKLDPAAKTTWSTTLGGSRAETLNAAVIGPHGRVYLTGATESPDFPVTPGSMQNWKPSERAAYVAVVRPDGDGLIYGTYLGGSPREEGYGLAVDAVGNAFVAGATGWPGFPAYRAIQPGFVQGICPAEDRQVSLCGGPGFLTVLTPSGEELVWSTFLGGGEHDAAYGVALDGSGAVYVTGRGLTLGRSNAISQGVGIVKIAPEGEPAAFQSDSVTDAASFRPGLPQPGGLATLFATGLGVSGVTSAEAIPLPYELAGVSVRVGGAPAPLLAVIGHGDVQQINFQVPFEARSRQVEVRRGGVSSFAEPLPVGPGIFGVRHASGAPVTAADPAVPGETVVIYCTGLGPVSPQIPSGYPAQGPVPAVTTPTVRIANFTADVQYAGLSAGAVGLYQVNARIPAETPPGSHVLTVESALPLDYITPAAWVGSNTVQLTVR